MLTRGAVWDPLRVSVLDRGGAVPLWGPGAWAQQVAAPSRERARGGAAEPGIGGCRAAGAWCAVSRGRTGT